MRQQGDVICILKNRAALIEMRPDGQRIECIFVRDDQRVVVGFYNAGVSVADGRRALGLDDK